MKALTRLYLTPATPETSDITPNIPRMLQPPPPKRQCPNLLQQHTSGIETMKIHPISSRPMPSLAAIESQGCARGCCRRDIWRCIKDQRSQGVRPSTSCLATNVFVDGQCRFLNQNLGVCLKQPNRLIDVDWVNMGKLWTRFTRFVCLCLAKIVKSDWLGKPTKENDKTGVQANNIDTP